jgi:hypothetical protein
MHNGSINTGIYLLPSSPMEPYSKVYGLEIYSKQKTTIVLAVIISKFDHFKN